MRGNTSWRGGRGGGGGYVGVDFKTGRAVTEKGRGVRRHCRGRRSMLEKKKTVET